MFTKVYLDILTVYKNFIHWNISKTIIAIASSLFWILFALPFLLIAAIIWYLSPIDWKSIIWALYMWNSVDVFILWELFKNLDYFAIIIFFLIFWILAFFFWSSYKYPLISKLYLSYIDGEKRNFFAWNNYFSLKKLWKYTGILGWVSLYLLIPFLVFILLIIALVFIFGWFDSISLMMQHSIVNIFSIFTFLFFIISAVLFFYIIYRTQFAFFSFIDEKYYDTHKKAKYYVKDSISITKSFKVFGQYILLLISMIVIMAPFFYIEANISGTKDELQLLVSAKTDETFQKTMTEDNKYEASILEKKYINYNDDDLKYELTKYNAFSTVWAILYFLFLWNIETMLFVSFYRRMLIADKIVMKEETEDDDEEVL